MPSNTCFNTLTEPLFRPLKHIVNDVLNVKYNFLSLSFDLFFLSICEGSALSQTSVQSYPPCTPNPIICSQRQHPLPKGTLKPLSSLRSDTINTDYLYMASVGYSGTRETSLFPCASTEWHWVNEISFPNILKLWPHLQF